MIGIYIRIKVDGKRTFKATPEIPGDYEYWLKSSYDGRQKWQRVGRFDGVKKAKLLLEREQYTTCVHLVSFSWNVVRADNESLRSGPHEIKRITSHQGKDRVIGIVEHLRIFRPHQLRRIDTIAIRSVQRRQRDFVAMPDVSQPPEECVPVSCDGDIPLAPRQGRARNVSDGVLQR